MRTFAIVNRKGGVGKTTTAAAMAEILATTYKQRVLFLDADSQGDATSLMLDNWTGKCGVAEILRGDVRDSYRAAIHHTAVEGLDIIPATEALADYELEVTLGRRRGNFHALQTMAEIVAGEDLYDVLIIDCPPYYSVSCLAALAACNKVIIPADLSGFSVDGLSGLVKQIENIRATRPDMQVAGVLLTQWHNGYVAQTSEETMHELEIVPVFETKIRRTDKAIESSWAGEPVGKWSPNCAAAKDYRKWMAELIEKEGWAI